MSRARTAPVAVATVLVTAWWAVQLVLCNRIAAGYRDHVFPPISGTRLAEPSLVAMVALTALAAALVVGGRGRWAYLVAGLPAASVVSWFWDGEPLGIGWAQNIHLMGWLQIGCLVDTFVLLGIIALLRRALPQRRAAMAWRIAVTRAVPVLVILAGWWLTHRPYGDPEDRVWLVRAALMVLVVALLAGSGLPLWARIATIAALPVLADPVTTDALIYRIDGMQMLHHVAFLAAVAAYVAGVPRLLAAAPAGIPRRADA